MSSAMETPSSLLQAAQMASRWYWSNLDRLPQDVLEPLMLPTASPVECVARTAEYIYARRDKLRKGDRQLGAALARFCESMGFFQMAVEGRGSAMSRVLLEGGDGPPPLPDYVEADDASQS